MTEHGAWEGKQVGPYRLENRLGAGGMGAVYRALDERLQRPVALKQILPSVGDGERSRKRFRREARAAAGLNHPGIVRIHDLFQAEGCDWIVMELVEGETLAQLLAKGALTLERTLGLAADIADALATAHAEGIVHRDLKAKNVVVTPEGRAKILDFGLAKQVLYTEGRSTSISIDGQILGTPQAMSPEQAMGRGVDLRSDLFSFGSLLYEMTTGVAPFRAENPLEMMNRVCTHHPPPVDENRPSVPSALAELVDRLLEKEPAQRPRSAGDVAQSLRQIADSPLVEDAKPARMATADGETVGATALTPGDSTPSHGERRQVTVLCCELVLGNDTSGSLDPEALYDETAEFERLVREVVERFEGHVANALGHRLVVCFGYPQAHEDDARRAIKAALELRERLAVRRQNSLAVRVGIHTGPGLVLRAGSQSEQVVLGQTLDSVTSLLNAAEASCVLVSESTRRLVAQGYLTEPFETGAVESLEAHRILKAVDASSQWQASETAIAPLVARELELNLLLERWHQARDTGQVVLVSGEAGIGKSRLVRAFHGRLVDEGAKCLHAHCSSFGLNSPLRPIIEMLCRLLDLNPDDAPERQLERLELSLAERDQPLAESVPLFAPVFGVPIDDSKYPPLALSPEKQRRMTFEAVADLLLRIAEQRPTALVVEDLHWVDPSTLELLNLLIGRLARGKLLMVLTFRLEFDPPWDGSAHLTQLKLSRLLGRDVEGLIDYVTCGKTLPEEVRALIVAKTDGVPLFVEELTRNLLESGQLIEHEDHWELAEPLRPLAVPSTLRDSLTERLDRLGTVRELAQLASVLGREFSYQILAEVSSLDSIALDRELARLISGQLIYRKGFSDRARYIFKHALIHDAAYDSLLKSRRQDFHLKIAEVLEKRLQDAPRVGPEILAHHYTEAGCTKPAIAYWQLAADGSLARSANFEAIEQTRKGLLLVESLPENTERYSQELALSTARGAAWSAAFGWGTPEVEEAFSQAQKLSELIGESPQLFWALRGQGGYYTLMSKVDELFEVGKQVATLAKSGRDSQLMLESGYFMGIAQFKKGDINGARKHFDRCLSFDQFDRKHPRPSGDNLVYDSGVSLLSWLSLVQWTQGYPDQARASVEKAIALGRRISHPFSLCFALVFSLFTYQPRGEVECVRRRGEEALSLCERHGFMFFQVNAELMLGWVEAIPFVDPMTGEATEGTDEGISRLQRCLEQFGASGAISGLPVFFSHLVEICLQRGLMDEAVAGLERAFRISEKGEHRWDADLHRLNGKVALALGGEESSGKAESCFQKALYVAREQGARSLELRAAIALARLWHSQGKAIEAHKLLNGLYLGFCEGFDTVDLKEARDVLFLLDSIETVSDVVG